MKSGESKEFDKRLREKFEHFRPTPPAGLWDKIAAGLDEAEPPVQSPLAAKHRRLSTWWLGVAATLLVTCGVVYWQNRPVSVTYLRADQQTAVKPEEADVASTIPEEAPESEAEPLAMERLRRVFAKRNRKERIHKQPQSAADDESSADIRSVKTSVPQELTVSASREVPLNGSPDPPEVARVPDIEPPVVLEAEQETMLATAEQAKQPFGLSNILNYVVGAVDQRDEKLVTFSSDEEGSLKLDFNFGLAKNRKKKIR